MPQKHPCSLTNDSAAHGVTDAAQCDPCATGYQYWPCNVSPKLCDCSGAPPPPAPTPPAPTPAEALYTCVDDMCVASTTGKGMSSKVCTSMCNPPTPAPPAPAPPAPTPPAPTPPAPTPPAPASGIPQIPTDSVQKYCDGWQAGTQYGNTTYQCVRKEKPTSHTWQGGSIETGYDAGALACNKVGTGAFCADSDANDVCHKLATMQADNTLQKLGYTGFAGAHSFDQLTGTCGKCYLVSNTNKTYLVFGADKNGSWPAGTAYGRYDFDHDAALDLATDNTLDGSCTDPSCTPSKFDGTQYVNVWMYGPVDCDDPPDVSHINGSAIS